MQQREDAGRDQLLQLLEERRDVAALCILGGVFGEGIDLPGEQLSSVVIVGVGLPQFNRDTEQLRAWYQQQYGAGFDYAYLFPGMQKVDQALGRVIRGSEDRGRALLIDSRYGERQYRELLPPWWTYRSWEEAKPIARLGKCQLYGADNALAETALAIRQVKLPHADEAVARSPSFPRWTGPPGSAPASVPG